MLLRPEVRLFSLGLATNLTLIFKTFFCVGVCGNTQMGSLRKGESLAMVTKENGPVIHYFLSSRIHSQGKHVITLISDRMRNSDSKEKSHRQATRPAENPGFKKRPAHKTTQQCTLESVFSRNKAGGNSDHN